MGQWEPLRFPRLLMTPEHGPSRQTSFPSAGRDGSHRSSDTLADTVLMRPTSTAANAIFAFL